MRAMGRAGEWRAGQREVSGRRRRLLRLLLLRRRAARLWSRRRRRGVHLLLRRDVHIKAPVARGRRRAVGAILRLKERGREREIVRARRESGRL